jgi:hypothetical protein
MRFKTSRRRLKEETASEVERTMRQVGVAISREKNREFKICFDENDVRRACRMMICSHNRDACIVDMVENGTTCELCYAVLTALGKYPVAIKPLHARSDGENSLRSSGEETAAG